VHLLIPVIITTHIYHCKEVKIYKSCIDSSSMLHHWTTSGEKTTRNCVYVLRDTNHTDTEIQENILTQLKRVFPHRIATVYSEGFSGEFPGVPHELSEAEEKERLIKRKGYWQAIEIFGRMHWQDILDGNLRIYGIEDMALFERHEQVFIDFGNAYTKARASETLPESEREPIGAELLRLGLEVFTLAEQRSNHWALTIAKDMTTTRTRASAVIGGDGHFKDLTFLLPELGFSMSNYYPGQGDISTENSLEYILQTVPRWNKH